MTGLPAADGIDGGVLDTTELAILVRRTAAELPAIFGDADPARRRQIGALVTVLDEVAARLASPGSAGDLRHLAAALDAADPGALAAARRIAAAARARMAPPNWELFG